MDATRAAPHKNDRSEMADDRRNGEAARRDWAATRTAMETGIPTAFHEPEGYERPWSLIDTFADSAKWQRRLRPLYRRGMRNALDIRLERIEFAFADLPEPFDGYTILHVTDPHFGSLDGIAERVVALVTGIDADACVLTGDYSGMRRAGFDHVIAPLGELVARVTVRDGFFATLGNHDSIKLVEPLERLGMRVLANQSVGIGRGGAVIHLTGLDDVHYFHTAKASAALRSAPAGFKIALVHSPEIAAEAAEAGFSFYIAGHTHGGQICLPGGRPILTNLRRGRRAHAVGRWRCGGMTGYTSRGAGVALLPLRFNSRGEITLMTLRRARPGG